MLTNMIPQDFDVFVGVDVSKKSFAVTHMEHTLKKRSFKMLSNPQGLYQYYQKRFANQKVLYVYEAGCTGYHLYDYLSLQNQDCLVVHPGSIQKSTTGSRVKNDRIDSEHLADQARGGQLQGIRVPDPVYRELRHLAVTRQQHVEDAQRTKRRIKSLILFENLKLPKDVEFQKHWSARYRRALYRLAVPNEAVRFQLDGYLKDLEHQHSQILSIHTQLRFFYRQHPEIQKHIQLLRSIPGFGFVVSMFLLARIGDPKHLRDIRELGAFAGLVPSEHSTGGTDRRGSITKAGAGTLRSLLIEAAWIAITKDKELREFYHRIRSKNGMTKGSKVAIVAVARKLTHRAYRVLKDQRSYVIH
jgi:transposase